MSPYIASPVAWRAEWIARDVIGRLGFDVVAE
jgi:hypothetical protein